MKNEMITVAMTGASGNMGQAVVAEMMKLSYVRIKLLLLDGKREHRLARRWTRQYGDRVEYFFGNMKYVEDCRKLVEDVDYVVNMAAIIPPLADKRPDLAHEVNVVGVHNLVTAIEDLADQPKLIHISTVAIYGHRDQQHPWGRVGDPLLPSPYDQYGMGKMIGERYVLDSNVRTWAVLRQTGILYEKLLMANVSDGLMFHTCFNVPIEWATDHDSGVLIKNIIAKDYHSRMNDFWLKVYNIGGGAAYRTTGYETFDMGFGMIGGSVEKFMEPNWYATRNFHCMWFADSDELEKRF
ncbi:MAG: NAD-dependent epimerase/dehydratase family protein, partial [Clostridia bacterium]|nr:NAD-dependent epimerase/dehydratase family protein [Clostridia bacterium]